ncbi:cytochrome c oxidase assembly protein [Virgibacillus ndiopensis]|uniref:cytochrome c oxidase assembly protein n=1 Tax=Virgibacillus ndiopensis TaxID=2004408 RepID=UPI000C082F02
MSYELLLAGQLEWKIPFLTLLLIIALLYLYLIKRFTKITFNHKQVLFFLSGLSLLSLTIGSPISAISHLTSSFHMIQMSIHYFIVPPLLLFGLPVQLYQQIWKVPLIKKLNKTLLPPKLALVIFSLLFFLYHLPLATNFLSTSSFYHNSYLFLLFIISFWMWWPFVNPKLCKAHKKQYAYLSGLLIMPACLLFIFSALMNGMDNPFLTQLTSHLCTPSPSSPSSLLPFPFNTRLDQVIAGSLMMGIHKLSIMSALQFRPNLKD